MASELDFKKEGEDKKSAPKGKKLNIGGKEYEVPDELASAIESEFSDRDSRFNTQASQLQQMQTQLQTLTTKPPTDKQDNNKVDYEELIFTNPQKFVETIREEVKAEIDNTANGVKDEILNSQQSEKMWNDFWKSFYKDNTDLKKEQDDLIVKAVLSQNWGEYQNLNVKDCQKKLADAARKVIKGYIKEPDIDGPDVEGGDLTSPGKTKNDDVQDKTNMSSLSSTLRDRRAKLFG